jgi:hypothetical protein
MLLEVSELEERTMTTIRRITPAIQEAARRNGALSLPVVKSEAHRARLRAAQQARRERERLESGGDKPPEPKEKRPVGRPRKVPNE